MSIMEVNLWYAFVATAYAKQCAAIYLLQLNVPLSSS